MRSFRKHRIRRKVSQLVNCWICIECWQDEHVWSFVECVDYYQGAVYNHGTGQDDVYAFLWSFWNRPSLWSTLRRYSMCRCTSETAPAQVFDVFVHSGSINGCSYQRFHAAHPRISGMKLCLDPVAEWFRMMIRSRKKHAEVDDSECISTFSQFLNIPEWTFLWSTIEMVGVAVRDIPDNLEWDNINNYSTNLMVHNDWCILGIHGIGISQPQKSIRIPELLWCCIPNCEIAVEKNGSQTLKMTRSVDGND